MEYFRDKNLKPLGLSMATLTQKAFHNVANKRKNINTIEKLENEDGIILVDDLQIKVVVLSFFKRLCTRKDE